MSRSSVNSINPDLDRRDRRQPRSKSEYETGRAPDLHLLPGLHGRQQSPLLGRDIKNFRASAGKSTRRSADELFFSSKVAAVNFPGRNCLSKRTRDGGDGDQTWQSGELGPGKLCSHQENRAARSIIVMTMRSAMQKRWLARRGRAFASSPAGAAQCPACLLAVRLGKIAGALLKRVVILDVNSDRLYIGPVTG